MPDLSPPRRIRSLAMALIILGACADSEPTRSSSASPHDLMPDAMSCADADATNVEAEPAYAADYLYRWNTYDGCSVRLDFVITRRGGCFEDVDDILIGWPLGTTHTHHDYRIYLRDPQDVTGAQTGGDLELDATLPTEAMDTGLRQEGSELWMVPGEDEFIWLVSPDSIERWPQGSVACA